MAAEFFPTLVRGPLSLSLAPARGGGIARFDCCAVSGGKIAIFRPLDEAVDSPVALASFPLVPFVNRVRGGAFNFRGRRVTLARNLPPDPSPLHGQGWQAAWEVERLAGDGARLIYRHDPGEWPWAYAAQQIFALDDRGLSLDLSCTNRSDEPMPCGLGQHPYFPCGRETKLDTRVSHVWTVDEQLLPVEKVPAEGRYDLRKRLVCGQVLDNGFGGWGGLAWMGDPGWPYELVLSSASAGFFQLYSPPEGGIFVAEPVTHANAALNEPESEWPELGMRVLQPGQEMGLDMTIEVVPK